MIRKDGAWTLAYNPGNRPSDERSEGKWIFKASQSRLDRLFFKINALVDRGALYLAKYKDGRHPEADLLPFSLPVLIVYSDDVGKASALEQLAALGIRKEDCSWKYRWETKRDWGPGGELRKEYECQQAIRLLGLDGLFSSRDR